MLLLTLLILHFLILTFLFAKNEKKRENTTIKKWSEIKNEIIEIKLI